MSAALKALMAIGTDCRLSERRCAVTVISSSEGASDGFISAASTGAGAQITQADVQKHAKPVVPAAARYVEPLFLIAPSLEFIVRLRSRHLPLPSLPVTASSSEDSGARMHMACSKTMELVAVRAIHSSV